MQPKKFVMWKLGLLIKIILTLLIFSAMVFMARVGVADFMRLRPCVYVDGLANGTVRLDPTALDHARKLLLLARSWDANNPVIPEYLGQIDFRLAQLVHFSPTMQATFLRRAIAEYDSALTLRPNSAYLWAGRMTLGSGLLQIKALSPVATQPSELTLIGHAMQRAALLDPWNPTVLKQIVTVGTLYYKAFSSKDQLIVDAAVTRTRKLGIH
ncbi:MAG: hypothetical protein R8K48_04385 [Gallionella sp.]